MVGPMEDNPAIEVLKKKYFELAPREDYPKTPKVSEELDAIEQAITKLTGKKLLKCSAKESVT